MKNDPHACRGAAALPPKGAFSSWDGPAMKKTSLFFAAIAAWLAMLSWVRPLMLPDEGRYAGVAWEMLRSHSHAVPLLNGMPYFHKPPLFYWLAEASFSVFGLNEFAARRPSVRAAWLAAAGLYLFVRRRRDAGTAAVATLILVTLPFFYGAAQFANLDMLVASLISLCILAGAEALLRAREGSSARGMMLVCAVLAGLAVLAKGLIGVALPAVVLLIWVASARRWKDLLVLLWPPAIGAFLLVAVPWFWLMQLRYPEFFHYFFIYQQFERFSAGGFNNVQPAWFYLPVLAGLALPWSAWAAGLFDKRFWTAPDGELRRLMLIWLAVILAFFSIPSSKLIGYIVPALPAFAFLLAEVVMSVRRSGRSLRWRRLFPLSVIGAATLCGGAMAAAAAYSHQAPKSLAIDIGARLRSGDTLVALHEYPFQLQLYSRSPSPIWVVDDWLDPQIPLRDNWRKELYDAAHFDPVQGQQVLLSDRLLRERLCEAPAGARYWIWGGADDATRKPLLANRQPVLSEGRSRVWLIEAGDGLMRQACGETPIAGLQ